MFKLLFVFFAVVHVYATDRIVTLSPSLNEIVFALGKGGSVVGNTEHCKYPKESLKVTKVGGYFSPSLEKILALEPTLVLMQKNNYKLNERLKQLGIKTKLVKIDRLTSIKETILEIGQLLSKETEAKNIVQNIDEELKKLKDITKNKRVLIVMGHNTSLVSRIFVAGQNLYFDDIINASGNTNALQSKRKGQPMLNMENIIACNPDIVILLAHSMEEKGLTRDELVNPWLELPISAAKTKSVYIINKLYAGIPSDRLALFLKDFREILNDYKNNN